MADPQNKAQDQDLKEISGTVITSVSSFVPNTKIIEEISNRSKIGADKAAKIATLFSQFLGIGTGEKLTELTQQVVRPEIAQQPSLSTMKERGFDIAKLALILPLLLNEEARSYLASFLKGLLGLESLNKITAILKLAGVALATVFAVKVLKQISDTITTFVRLAKLTALLFGLTQASADITYKEQKKLEKRKQRDKTNRTTRRENRKKRIERIRKIKDIVGKIKKGVLIGGPVGIAAGIVSGIIINSLIDFVLADEEKINKIQDDAEDNETPDGEVIVPTITDEMNTDGLTGIIIDNTIKEITGGLLSAESFRNLYNVLKGDKKTIEKNQAAIAGSAGTMDAELEALGYTGGAAAPPPEQPTTKNTRSAAPARAPASPSSSQSQPSGSSPTSTSVSKPSIVPSTPQSGPTSTPSSTPSAPASMSSPESSASTSGVALNGMSEEVVNGRKDLQMNNSSNIIVDNSLVVVAKDERSNPISTTNYSLSVGVT